MPTSDAIADAVRGTKRRIVLKPCLLIGVILCAILLIIWVLFPSRATPPARTDWHGLDKALIATVRDGDHLKAASLLDQGADANNRDEVGETVVMQAALNSDAQMMGLLLQRGASATARCPNGVPVLLRAVHDARKVRLLLNCGAPVEDPAMVLAAMIPGSRKALELMLRYGGNANADVAGFTALMGAAFGGDLEAVGYLIEHGALVNARTRKGFTALHAAAVSGNAGVMELLLSRGADPNARYELPRGNGDIQTPTMAAAEQGHTQCLKLLLDRGADVNVQGGPFERAALLCAATTGNEEAVRLLIAKRANVNAEDWEGKTPLAWARKRGETNIVRLLRQAGGREPPPYLKEKNRPRLHLHGPIHAGSVRLAVAAALPRLQRSALKITEAQGCITCHQHSLLAMTVGMVRKHGLPIDEEMASQTQSEVVRLLSLKIPAVLLAADFDALLAPYTLVGMAAEDKQPNRLTDALVHYLVLRQKTDGRWLAEAYRPPEDGSDFMFTALAVRGLQVYAPEGRRKEVAARIHRARAWLERAKPAETVDTVFQCLGLHWANAGSKAVQEAASRLLREQREDGGWSQLATLPSDAYAPGQALFALHEAGGVSINAPAYRRGVEFLLSTQLADGTWFVPTRCFPVLEFSNSGFPHGKSQYSSAAATCWATMALAQSFSLPGGEVAKLQ